MTKRGIVLSLSNFWKIILPMDNKNEHFINQVKDYNLKTGQIVQIDNNELCFSGKKVQRMQILRKALFVYKKNIYEISTIGFGSGADNICSKNCVTKKNETVISNRQKIIELYKNNVVPITYIIDINVNNKNYKVTTSLFSNLIFTYDIFGNKLCTNTQTCNLETVTDEIENIECEIRKNQCLTENRKREIIKMEQKKIKKKNRKQILREKKIKKQEEYKKKKKIIAKKAKKQAEKNYQDEMFFRREEMKRNLEFELKRKKQATQIQKQLQNSKKYRKKIGRLHAEKRRQIEERDKRRREEAEREMRRQQKEYWQKQEQHEQQRNAVNGKLYKGKYKGINPYHVLGISYEKYSLVSNKEIEKYYKKQFIRFHPDKHQQKIITNPELYNKCLEISKMLNAAKAVLLSDEKVIIDIFLQNPDNWTGFNSTETLLFDLYGNEFK